MSSINQIFNSSPRQGIIKRPTVGLSSHRKNAKIIRTSSDLLLAVSVEGAFPVVKFLVPPLLDADLSFVLLHGVFEESGGRFLLLQFVVDRYQRLEHLGTRVPITHQFNCFVLQSQMHGKDFERSFQRRRGRISWGKILWKKNFWGKNSFGKDSFGKNHLGKNILERVFWQRFFREGYF